MRVIGHVIISHGLQSSPEASKATALARVAMTLGWSVELPDYREIDAHSVLGDVPARIAKLRARAEAAVALGHPWPPQHSGSCPSAPLVLAGSSMGAFISGHVSCAVPVAGLFLMAPPVALEVAPHYLRAAVVPTAIIHGWQDELIPAMDVVRWAQRRHDALILVRDSHRLAEHVDYCADEFGRFLQRLAA